MAVKSQHKTLCKCSSLGYASKRTSKHTLIGCRWHNNINSCFLRFCTFWVCFALWVPALIDICSAFFQSGNPKSCDCHFPGLFSRALHCPQSRTNIIISGSTTFYLGMRKPSFYELMVCSRHNLLHSWNLPQTLLPLTMEKMVWEVLCVFSICSFWLVIALADFFTCLFCFFFSLLFAVVVAVWLVLLWLQECSEISTLSAVGVLYCY